VCHPRGSHRRAKDELAAELARLRDEPVVMRPEAIERIREQVLTEALRGQ